MKKEMFDTLDSRILKNYEVIKKIGQGAYGQVWKVKNKKTNNLYAIKKIYDAFRNSTDALRAYREIKYLERLKGHPNIIKIESYLKPILGKDIYMVMQFMEADLSTALKNSVLKDIHKHYIFYQLANAVQYLHSSALIHRDIKPSNILVNQNCEVKLCDFGLLRSLASQENFEPIMTQNIATRWYRAPQVLLSCTNYGYPIDVWSMGCVLAELFLGKPIFQGNSSIHQLQIILQLTGKPSPQDLLFIQNKPSLAIINSIQILEPKRIHTYFKFDNAELFDLLQKIFRFNPQKRLTVKQIMNHSFLLKFRGRIQEKLSEKAIIIDYQKNILEPNEYRNLLQRQDEKSKSKDQLLNQKISIYKTMPNISMNQTYISKYSNKNNPEKNMNFGKQQKQVRHSPAFLNKKNQSPSPLPNKVFKIKKQNSSPLHVQRKDSSFEIKEKTIKSPFKNLDKDKQQLQKIQYSPQKIEQAKQKIDRLIRLKYSPGKSVKNINKSPFNINNITISMKALPNQKVVPKFLQQILRNRSKSPIKTQSKQKYAQKIQKQIANKQCQRQQVAIDLVERGPYMSLKHKVQERGQPLMFKHQIKTGLIRRNTFNDFDERFDANNFRK